MDDGGAASVRAIMHWQYRTICRGNNSILQNLYEVIGPKTRDYISFYGLRSYGRLFDGGPVASSQVLCFADAPNHICTFIFNDPRLIANLFVRIFFMFLYTMYMVKNLSLELSDMSFSTLYSCCFCRCMCIAKS